MKRLLLISVMLPLCVLAAEVETYQNPQTGLTTWRAEEHGFSLELIPLLPDFVRATYESRHLPKQLIESVVSQCVFGTIAINKAKTPLSYRVADWYYVSEGGEKHKLKTKSEWVSDWRNMGVSFRWSLLPDDQTFEVGDWSQGFTTVGLSPNERFDLVYIWEVAGKRYSKTIKGMRCAPEKLPNQ